MMERLYYLQGDFRDAARFEALKALLAQLDERHHTPGNYFYYLATAPQFFGEIVHQAGRCGADQGRARRSGGAW